MKIDTNLFENFENLTADELREKIKNLDLEVPDSEEVSKLKNLLNKASGEASNYKKQLREKEEADRAKMSEEEKEKADREAADRAKDELIAKLQREQAVTTYTAKLIGLGMKEDEAKKTAQNMPNGLDDTFFSAMSKYKDDMERNIRADITKNTPRPDKSGDDNKGITKEDFNKMSYKERVELKNSNPTEYEALKGE